jgi:hypothetical protein|tara:strand:+ start:4433 stop:4672 length:240 start_codon:yes stop_codon:yes gene_type:complete
MNKKRKTILKKTMGFVHPRVVSDKEDVDRSEKAFYSSIKSKFSSSYKGEAKARELSALSSKRIQGKYHPDARKKLVKGT